MNDYRPPDRLPYINDNERPMNQTPIVKLQKRTVQLFKRLTAVSILMSIGLFIMNMDMNNPTAIIQNQMFMPCIAIFIGAFFALKFLGNQLVWTIDITPNRYGRKTPRAVPNTNIPKAKENNVTTQVKQDIKEIQHPVSFGYAVTPMATIYITMIMGCLVFLLICIWSIDVSVSAINVSKTIDPSQIQVTNGFFSRNVAINYHMALYGVIISSVLLAFICLKLMTVNSKTKSVMALKLPDHPILRVPRPVVFNMVSNFLVIPIMLFMVVAFILASMNSEYIVQFEFNRFGEGLPELIMVTAIFVMVILNAFWSIKLYKANRSRLNE